MTRVLLPLFVVACGGEAEKVATTGSPVTGVERAELFRALRAGGYVIYFRHATADVGTDADGEDVPEGWWMSCDSTRARQLSREGRQLAEELGEKLANLELPLKGIYTSEFCRCKETAQAMRLDDLPIMTAQELTAGVYPHADRYQSMLDFAAEHGSPESVLVLVGHSLPDTGGAPQLDQGDAALFRWREGGRPAWVTRLAPEDWPKPGE